MHAVLFLFYFILLGFAVTHGRFFRAAGIQPFYILLLFCLHVAAGCVHNWIAYRFFPHHGDIWFFFEESVRLKQLLSAHPEQYFSDLFSGNGRFNITDTSKPVLDIQYQLLQHLNVLLNFLSFNNLYINTLLFSFPVFAGSIALFRVFHTAYRNLLPACCAVLLPSILFWTSVVYKDGLFYMAAGYFFYFFLQPRMLWKNWSWTLICVVLMFLTRANALITLLPAAFFLLLTERKLMRKDLSLAVTILFVFAGAFIADKLMANGILYGISERQKDFQSLTGGSKLYLPVLEPNVVSLMELFPAALFNGFFQPLPGMGGKSTYTAFSAELMVCWIIILYACWLMIKSKTLRLSNFDAACLLFALPGLMIIGYMVPFAGAIIRYRSVYLPFLLAPFINICCTYSSKNISRLNSWLHENLLTTAGKTR